MGTLKDCDPGEIVLVKTDIPKVPHWLVLEFYPQYLNGKNCIMKTYRFFLEEGPWKNYIESLINNNETNFVALKVHPVEVTRHYTYTYQ